MKLFSGKRKAKGDVCSVCGTALEEHQRDLAFKAPAYWSEEASKSSHLDTDFCSITKDGVTHNFARGLLLIPIIGTDDAFGWGVWVSLSEKNFARYKQVFGTNAEQDEPPYFGWLSNDLPGYPDCLTIKTQVHLKGGGMRPHIELDHDNEHPLCQEQHHGITLDRVHELLSHPPLDE